MTLPNQPGAPLSDPLFYLVAVPAVLLVGISKGGFGGGFGLIGVPLIALAVPLRQAAGILLPLLCLMDLFALWTYRSEWSCPNVRALLPGVVLGIAAGAWAFGQLDERWIRALVGTITVLFAAQYWLGLARRAGIERPAVSPRDGAGWLWGALSGFSSTVAHAGGPPLSVYLLPQRLQPTLFVGTTVILFAAMNYLKLVPYGWLGVLEPGNLATSLALTPVAPIGVILGRWLVRRVNEVLFYRIAYALLLAVGARLLLDGLVG